jgi:hypothetical protein
MLSQLTPPPELKDGISGAQVNGNETATVGCSLQRHQDLGGVCFDKCQTKFTFTRSI